jgi:hypothetical protein
MTPICELPNPLFNLCWIFWCWLTTDNNGYWKWCTNSCCNTWFTNRCYNMWCSILNITMGDNCNPNHFFPNEYISWTIAFLKHQMNLSNFMSWMSMCKINWSSFPYFYVWNYSLINLCDEHTTSSIDMRSFMCCMNKILVISSKIILLRMKAKWNVCKITFFTCNASILKFENNIKTHHKFVIYWIFYLHDQI